MPRYYLLQLITLASLFLGLSVGGAPLALAAPAECDRQLDAPPNVYLSGWVPGAVDDPQLPPARDPLGEVNALAGKPLAILNRWEHWGMESDGGVASG